MNMFLIPNNIRRVTIAGRELVINEKIIPDNMVAPRKVAAWVKKGQPMKPRALLGGDGRPRGVTVHNTNDIRVASGTNAAEQYTRATFNGNMKGVVVHFYVWKGEIWQNLRLDERGWHAGDGSTRRDGRRPGQRIGGNLDTVAIEAIGPHAETTETTALLCAWLCQEFGFDPPLDLWQHADFSPRSGCPKYIRRSGWARFVQKVSAHLSAPAVPAAAATNDIALGDRVRIKVVGIPYFPGGTIIPAWLDGRELTVNGLREMGGVPAARLQEITSWCAIANLEKVG